MTTDEREPQREHVRAILRQSHICELRALARRTADQLKRNGLRGIAAELRRCPDEESRSSASRQQ
jgi:hypothetical protein